MEKHLINLADGRNLEVHTSGAPQANAIIFHHGTPGAVTTWNEWLPEVAARGGFAIAYSRPGYGLSSRHEGRTVLDNTKDMAQILKHFGVEKITSVGWSGGGPHSMADTVLPQSVAVISIAGVGEYDVPDLDFLAGMGEENHVEFGAAVAGKNEIEQWMKKYSGDMATVTGEQLIEAFGGLIGDADKKSLTTEVAAADAAVYRHALSKGYFGWMDDDLAFVQPWGFDITKISQPVELWQGDQDFMVPHAHGHWLEKKIPTAKLIFVPGEGHISLGIKKRDQMIENALGFLG